MAQETINTIREAELAADQLEKDATEKGNRILQEAKRKAEELYYKITEEARTKAEAKLTAAQQQGDQIIARELELGDKEIEGMVKVAAAKETEAVKLVLSELY